MEQVNNKYQVQGVDLLSVVEKFGDPVYVYDASKIKKQYESLTGAFKGVDLHIKYAMKSNSNLSILKYIRSLGAGLDAVSINEVKLGLKAGFDPKNIIFTPSGVEFAEVEESIGLGVQLNIDSISALKKLGEKYGNKIPVSIRINPHIMAGGNHKISVGHIDSKFGVSIAYAEQVLEVIKSYDIDLNGVHMHTGSDILDADAFLKGAEVLFDFVKKVETIKFIDFGGGFKVPYKEGDIKVDIDDLGENITRAFNQFQDEYKKPLQLWFEPGKYLVSEAGLLLVKTNVVKPSPNRTFVVVNSGLNHLIRPMMYDAYHDIINISNLTASLQKYTVVGYICETDTFGEDRQLNEVQEGDILAIKNAGAYAFSMSSNYNSRFRPPEVLIVNGEVKLIRERETFDKLLDGQIEIDI
ncbi:MAG: diaminopimelate decarboxylase [Bacteroidota bacterium]